MYYTGYYNPEKESWKIVEHEENDMKFSDYTIAEGPGDCGWYIYDGQDSCLHKNLKFYDSTGYSACGCLDYGQAPGYYPTKKMAETWLRLYLSKEKHNMADKVEITVAVNGKSTPLHEISEQTLLTIRENSKPKEVPVARVATHRNSQTQRLILKVPGYFGKYADRIVVLNAEGEMVNSWPPEYEESNLATYENIQVIV